MWAGGKFAARRVYRISVIDHVIDCCCHAWLPRTVNVVVPAAVLISSGSFVNLQLSCSLYYRPGHWSVTSFIMTSCIDVGLLGAWSFEILDIHAVACS